MDNFLLIIVCLVVGQLFSRLRLVPEDTYKGINLWVVNIALPALSLRYIPYIEADKSLFILIITPAIIWFGALVFVHIYSLFVKLDKGTKAALFVVSALSNTGFVGFPLIMTYYGEQALSYAIIVDQATFVLFATVTAVVVMRQSAGSASMRQIYGRMIFRLFRFPPFIGCILAFILPHFVDISPLNGLFESLADTLSPMALFSIGLQLRLGEWKSVRKEMVAGLFYKLILAPALVFAAVLGFSGGEQGKVAVMQGAMPSHITASIMASQNNLNPHLCTMMAGLSILAAFVTTFFWYLASKAL